LPLAVNELTSVTSISINLPHEHSQFYDK